MGVDYRANVVVGVLVSEDDFLVRHTAIDKHEHETPKHAQFCPTCGMRVNVEKEVVEVLEPFGALFYDEDCIPEGTYGAAVHGLHLFSIDHNGYDGDRDGMVLGIKIAGWGSRSGGSPGAAPLKAVGAASDAVRLACTHLGWEGRLVSLVLTRSIS